LRGTNQCYRGSLNGPVDQHAGPLYTPGYRAIPLFPC
jgi:hypothetical protein